LFETQVHARDVRRATVIDDGPGAMGISKSEAIAADRRNSIRIVKSDIPQHDYVFAAQTV
jgi:hypothetical protein